MNISGVEIHLSDGGKKRFHNFLSLFLVKMLRKKIGKIYSQTFLRRRKTQLHPRFKEKKGISVEIVSMKQREWGRGLKNPHFQFSTPENP